jgi:apolipoprotein N-acyltransferase
LKLWVIGWAGIGGYASLTALSGLGTAGLSAAGITSGLATAGGLVGGGMVAGIGVLAAPIAVLGIVGYSVFKHNKIKKQTAALHYAIVNLNSVLDRLKANAQYFQNEIVDITALINVLESRAPA